MGTGVGAVQAGQVEELDDSEVAGGREAAQQASRLARPSLSPAPLGRLGKGAGTHESVGPAAGLA